MADYLQAYAKAFDLPVRGNAKVAELRWLEDGVFEVWTADASYQARQVVVATGPFQVPFVPPPAAQLDPSVTPLHSADDRTPRPSPRARCWWWAGELGLPDRRGAGRHPHRRPVDRHHLSDGCPAAGRSGPVLVADPPGAHGERGAWAVLPCLSWQHTRGSALLGFVNDDATYLADHIATGLGTAASAPAAVTQQPSSS